MVQQCHWAGDDTNLHGYAASDGAGESENMKSTSGRVIMWSEHCGKGLVDFAICVGLELSRSRIVRHDKTGSSTQWCNQHGQRLWRDLDRSCKIRVQQCKRNSPQRWFGRSMPTISRCSICGSSQRSRMGDLKFQKILGTNNVTDTMTKTVDRWALDKYMAPMSFTLMPDRADKASRAQ